MRIPLTVISMVLVSLALPALFKEKGVPAVVGPELSDLEFSEVSFRNSDEDFQLSGMLFLPHGDGPFPTAIIIPGSGPSKRNSVWYLSIAKHLQDNGIAVLLPDKRGSEKSEGEWVGASIEELATDTLSAVEFVRQQQMYAHSTIGPIGVSQGGWIAPVVAASSDDVSFAVSMSGSALTSDDTLVYQETKTIGKYTYTFIARFIAPISANSLKQKEHLSALYPFDPIPYWKNVQVPVFFAFGENDPDVPVEASIDRLNENDLGHFTVRTYPDGGHGILDGQTHEVSGEYLNDLVAFIKGAS